MILYLVCVITDKKAKYYSLCEEYTLWSYDYYYLFLSIYYNIFFSKKFKFILIKNDILYTFLIFSFSP